LSLINDFMSARYKECLNYPLTLLTTVAIIVVVASVHVTDFRFDASAETLVAEGDDAYRTYRDAMASFDGDNFAILTLLPRRGELLSDENVARLQWLEDELLAIEGVTNVVSILDAPLLESPPVPLESLADNVRTLRSPDVDRRLALDELTRSPLFRELLVSADGRSTAIRIDLERNSSPEVATRKRDETLREIRRLMAQMNRDVVSHLGGVPVVASDMVSYIERDIASFGSAVVLLMAIMLYVIFRRVRWVVLPLLTSATSVYLTIALLGYLDKPTTVISSNFVSLLTIIAISFTIHLISRYRELRAASPDSRHVELVVDAMLDKFKPCVFTALTTMVAFGSLTTSDIQPVKDLGWIMCAGLLISLIVTYSLFAGLLLLLPKGKPAATLHRAGVHPIFPQARDKACGTRADCCHTLRCHRHFWNLSGQTR